MKILSQEHQPVHIFHFERCPGAWQDIYFEKTKSTNDLQDAVLGYYAGVSPGRVTPSGVYFGLWNFAVYMHKKLHSNGKGNNGKA